MVRQLWPCVRAAAMARSSSMTAAPTAKAASTAALNAWSAGVLSSVSGQGVSMWDAVTGGYAVFILDGGRADAGLNGGVLERSEVAARLHRWFEKRAAREQEAKLEQ